jgi:transposase-like protein
MGKRMNNASYDEWEKPDKLEAIEAWASQGLSLGEIAHNMGIARSTLFVWRDKSKDISDAIKRGADASVDLVENALFNAATKDGNITAMIFYLKNKRPDAWKDKRENEISGNGEMRFSWKAKQKDEEPTK